MKLSRFFLLVVIVMLLPVAAAAWFYLEWMERPLPVASSLEFQVSPGMGVRKVAQLLTNSGVPVSEDMLTLAARVEEVLSGRKTDIHVGYYTLTEGMTPRQLLRMMAEGKVAHVEVRLIEGRTFRDWRRVIAAHDGLEHLATSLSDAELMKKIGMPGQAPEGMFFPDTYRVSKYSSDIALLAYAAREMRAHLEREWNARAENLPYNSPYEALIMASIVEKETGMEKDRVMVAGVFVNRLRIGMRLDADPTVIYGLGESYDGKIYRSDLRADTPYNTYTRKGLPPTPIAMPSLASIRAALNPAATNAFYFVAKGDGSSHFSATLAEHNQAVQYYLRSKGK
ncbi:MAG: endolytic transglycosylase MltG [Betaproteobacteria bacterium]|nr:endolytic transglycosylase MltG [Betaproteobacteria bacterium]